LDEGMTYVRRADILHSGYSFYTIF